MTKKRGTTEAIAWPYSLAKRAKAYCLVQGQDQADPIVVAAGGRFESVVRIGVGHYDVNLSMDMHTDAIAFWVSTSPIVVEQVAFLPAIANCWGDIGNVDQLHVATFDAFPGPDFTVSDLPVWSLLVWEPLASENLAPWVPPMPPAPTPP